MSDGEQCDTRFFGGFVDFAFNVDANGAGAFVQQREVRSATQHKSSNSAASKTSRLLYRYVIISEFSKHNSEFNFFLKRKSQFRCFPQNMKYLKTQLSCLCKTHS